MTVEQELWTMGQRSRQLQELRRDTRGAWDDEAARELAWRLLNPHQREDGKLLEALAEQAAALARAADRQAEAERRELEATHGSERAREALESAEADVSHAWKAFDLFVAYEARAREALPAIAACIERANRACE
jgi:hypothetical protein